MEQKNINLIVMIALFAIIVFSVFQTVQISNINQKINTVGIITGICAYPSVSGDMGHMTSDLPDMVGGC